ncbi:hypothetical protein P7C73_g6138, partial [Tremellales sp. Uapishka_1]
MTGLVSIKDPVKLFYTDLSASQADPATKLLRPAPGLASLLSSNAYGSVPSAYLYTEKDAVLPFRAQQELVRRARERGMKVVKEYRFDTAHSPFINRTEDVVDAVVDFSNSLGV